MKIEIPPEERCEECKGTGPLRRSFSEASKVIVSRDIKTFFAICPTCAGTGRNTSDIDELSEKIRRKRKELGIKKEGF